MPFGSNVNFDPNELDVGPVTPAQEASDDFDPTELEQPAKADKKKKGKKKKKKKGKKAQKGPDLMADPSAPGNIPEGYGPGSMGSPYDTYLSTVPFVEGMRDFSISDALSDAGFDDERYIGDAASMGARAGNETNLALQANLASLLYGQGEADMGRALEAGMQGGDMGMSIDQMLRSRMGAYGQMAMQGQRRSDSNALRQFGAMNQDDWGMLPMLINFATGTPGDQYGSSTTAGGPGAMDYAIDAAEMYEQYNEGQG